jgi:hypothetical protein
MSLVPDVKACLIEADVSLVLGEFQFTRHLTLATGTNGEYAPKELDAQAEKRTEEIKQLQGKYNGKPRSLAPCDEQ